VYVARVHCTCTYQQQQQQHFIREDAHLHSPLALSDSYIAQKETIVGLFSYNSGTTKRIVKEQLLILLGFAGDFVSVFSDAFAPYTLHLRG